MSVPATVVMNPDAELLTMEQFRKCLPRNMQANVLPGMIAEVNEIILNSPEREAYRDNVLSYTSVLKEGRYSVKAYLRAVRYVGFKLIGDTNFVAYTKTFPDRYQKWLNDNWADKDMNSAISTYHRTQLVTKILQQALIPQWLLNQDLYQKALNVSADLMLNARSEKVRADAANNLLNQLKMPETSKVELDVTMKEDDSIADLRKTTLELVAQQRKMIEAGAMKAGDVARQKIVAGEIVSEQ
jgi:hypothetical protein